MTDPAPAAVVAAAQELYAVPPDAFIARRGEMVASAKADGDAGAAKEIGRLRRPSVSAWALNSVVRQEPEVVADLLALGARMREAQGAMDVASLQAMRPERDDAVSAFVAAAVACLADAGRPLAPAGRDEVRATAVTVLADQAAADALASGILTKALSYSGFGEVDLSDALAVTGTGVVLTALAGGAPHGTDSAGDGERAASDDPGADHDGVGADHDGVGAHDDGVGTDHDGVGAHHDGVGADDDAMAAARHDAEAADAAHVAARARAEEAATELASAEARLDEARRQLEVVRDVAEAARAADRAARAAVTEAARHRKRAQAYLARLSKGKGT